MLYLGWRNLGGLDVLFAGLGDEVVGDRFGLYAIY